MARVKYIFVLILSALSLLWERLWNRLWAVISLFLLFTGLSLLRVPEMFGQAGPLVAFCLFMTAFVIVFFGTKNRFSFPWRSDIQRHVEKTSALKHRPLETLSDKPADGLSEAARDLWHRHLQKTAGYLDKLKIYRPSPNVAQRDRYALRYAALLLFVIGLSVAQRDAGIRLQQAFIPDLSPVITQKSATFDLWISPPEYTHESAIFLATARQGVIASNKNIQVPEGSTLKLRLNGYRFSPGLYYAGQRHVLTEAAPKNFTLDLPLQHSGMIRLSYFLHSLGAWNIAVAADTVPEVSILKVEETAHAATKITYKATDDHGITKISGIIAPAPDMLEKLDHIKYRFDIPPSDTASHIEDLTAHIWSGLPVTLTLEAEDSAGHKSASAPYALTLPARSFTNPIARILIEQRKKLLWAKDADAFNEVASNIINIVNKPELYKNDGMTFLALMIAAKRLGYDSDPEAVESVQDLLWDVALRLDDGGLSLAQRELRSALQKLSSSLGNKNLSKQEIQEIVDDVQKKMQQYVQALAMELQQRLQQGKQIPALSPDLAKKFMKNIDLGKMLQQMQALAQSGSRDDLKKMAESLKNTLDNLDMKKFDQMQQKQMQAMEALQNLEDIIHSQQSLLDDTNKNKDPAKTKDQAREQSDIRKKLGEALEKLAGVMDSIPDNFANASQSMKLSENALGEGKATTSLPYQKNALDQLQKGMDDAISQMAQSMQQSILSFGMMPSGGNYGEGFDPLGRGVSNGDVKIPDEKEQRRVQKIIEELRHRSNDSHRTKVERDYIDRLLGQF